MHVMVMDPPYFWHCLLQNSSTVFNSASVRLVFWMYQSKHFWFKCIHICDIIRYWVGQQSIHVWQKTTKLTKNLKKDPWRLFLTVLSKGRMFNCQLFEKKWNNILQQESLWEGLAIVMAEGKLRWKCTIWNLNKLCVQYTECIVHSVAAYLLDGREAIN